jgi:site-specific recombinase XerD
MTSDIEKHFRVFGLDSSATPAQVKEARQWYTKAFHPDRFPRDSKDQKRAEEQQKEINLAFERITAWFDTGAKGGARKVKEQPAATAPSGWQDELGEYLEYLYKSERATVTLRNIGCDLELFAAWLAAHGIHKRLDTNLAELVPNYAKDLLAQGYRPSTVSRHLYTIRGWFVFAKVETGSLLSLASQYKAQSKSQPKALTEKQVSKLLDSLDQYAPIGDQALIEFLLHTGLTAGEVCEVCWNEVSTVPVPGSRQGCLMLEVTGRGGKRKIPLSELAVLALQGLGLQEVLKRGGKELHNAIFEKDGYPQTPKMVHYAVNRWAEVAGVPATPSSLRNTFAKRLAASGVPRHHLAEYMGISEQSASVYYPTQKVSTKDLLNASRKG